jgi:hypothetical protein
MHRILAGDLSGYWSPRTTDEFLDLGAGFNTMLFGLRERETLKDTFGRFVSRDVAAAVLGGQVPLQGEIREVSILFQDIRGFTSLSERTAPAALLPCQQFLPRWWQRSRLWRDGKTIHRRWRHGSLRGAHCSTTMPDTGRTAALDAGAWRP